MPSNTLTEICSGVMGDRKYTIREYDIETYPTGGLSILPEDLGFTLIDDVFARPIEAISYPLFDDNGIKHYKITYTMTVGTVAAGHCTFTVDGVDYEVAIALTDTTAVKVGEKVYAGLRAVLLGQFNISYGATHDIIVIEALDRKTHTFAFADTDTTTASAAGVVTSNMLMVYSTGTTQVNNATDIGKIRIFALGK